MYKTQTALCHEMVLITIESHETADAVSLAEVGEKDKVKVRVQYVLCSSREGALLLLLLRLLKECRSFMTSRGSIIKILADVDVGLISM